MLNGVVRYCLMLCDTAQCCSALADTARCCLMSFGIIWYYLMLFDTAWWCLALFGTACCLVSFGVVWCWLMLFDAVWWCLMLFDVVWCAWCCLAFCDTAWCCLMLFVHLSFEKSLKLQYLNSPQAQLRLFARLCLGSHIAWCVFKHLIETFKTSTWDYWFRLFHILPNPPRTSQPSATLAAVARKG